MQIIETPHLQKTKAPACFSAGGQPLLDLIFQEGRILQEAIDNSDMDVILCPTCEKPYLMPHESVLRNLENTLHNPTCKACFELNLWIIDFNTRKQRTND